MSSTRADLRLAFARHALSCPTLELESASADASFRSYWRTVGITPSRIVMDAPPEREDLGPWLQVARQLNAADIAAPQILAEDLQQGFLLLSDLGRQTLLPLLSQASVDGHYQSAIDTIVQMQQRLDASGLPTYDHQRLTTEMELMPAWLLQKHLGYTPECEEWDVIESAFQALLDNAAAQPQAFVHRDYHSRNLMVQQDGTLAVIDFQDAVRGPITYDPVSLLRDCYIEWPDEQVYAWLDQYRQRLAAAGGPELDREQLNTWFDLMGLQRHIKVLGIFCRLWYRDAKPGYLGDLPLVWRYTQRVGRRYEKIRPLIELLERVIGERDLCQPVALQPEHA
ncbi:aminoglycoside phosphotransferase family protein [Pseudomarimonas arenosa]|uniref:Phosphotransferase n=1 Tax=Pseudomarimonas arenosa TaxID=2774145 RepID=A0AAW3ZL97_9GAMM|nr:phosphotransferase [Pseudomarimonas arenosa]MBD8525957.1 phosphotransferase [Pseudomarimonas arenosa]